LNARYPELRGDREIVIERLVAAPARTIWRLWAEPGHIEQWWGPDGFTTTTHSHEFREGGEWRFTMHGPDGRDYENRIVYTEIVEPHRIAYRHGGEVDVEPVNFSTVVTFEERDTGTLVTLHSTFESSKTRDFVIAEYGAVEGGRQHLARMAAAAEDGA
jgi:uncharacterized protein YndB with AHSA1/START domain